MTCTLCQNIEDVTDSSGPYVIRPCRVCGREMKFREPGAHGIGFQVRAGDQVVIPANWLKIAANPLRGSGSLSRPGLDWFAKLVFVDDLAQNRANFSSVLDALSENFEEILSKSPKLVGFDLKDSAQVEAVYNVLKQDESSCEWVVYIAAVFLSIVKKAIDDNDAALAAWAMANAERFRALYVFKEHFEEVVWMGHSAKRLIDLLSIWDANKENSDEEFWQIQFQSHALALSQLFSVPVALIEGKAYVGGQGIDRQDARLVDFLFSGGSANEAILIEIKTPVTPLMQKSSYRGNAYAPTKELAGSVVQVADYRHVLVRDLGSLIRGRVLDLSTFNPKAVVIVGNSTSLGDENRRRSFELFRSSLSNVEIVTFDEVFQKIEHLASLFNLVRTQSQSTVTS